MGVTIYNFDKIDRNKECIEIKGVKHYINEPTVNDYCKISKLDFEDTASKPLEALAHILAPTVDLGELTTVTTPLFYSICFKAMRGEFLDGKKWKLAELKKE